jgi:AcrR family transcriptional regulator
VPAPVEHGGRDPGKRCIPMAAWAALNRSHVRSLKIRQVLTASNTSAGSVYRLFPGKSHLLLASLEEEMRPVNRRPRVSSIPPRLPRNDCGRGRR